MPAGPAQDSVVAAKHLILFDGVCGLCNGLVQFVLARDHRRVFAFAALQGDAGTAIAERLGGDPAAMTTLFVVPNYRSADAQHLSRSRAALFIARELGWPWKAAGSAGIVPAPLLDRLYDVVARHRYRVFGKRDQCMLPRPEDRGRFIGQ
jgi:predicted DCC family thiol-disulfide oxidoreductase YuxK